MSWRRRYESLIIVYDLEKPRRRVIDYVLARADKREAEGWARFLAEKHNMKRYGYILYHMVTSGEVG